MAFLLLVLFASVVVCQGTEKTLFFYQASNQAWHVNEDNTVLVVSNSDAFPIQHGFALASYSREGYSATLLSYTFLSNPDLVAMKTQSLNEAASTNDCPLFGKKVMVTVYRVQHRNDQEGCVSVDTVKRYLQYMDSHLRLQSGNRIRMDIDGSVISNVCCPCSEEECYGPNQYHNFMNKVTERCTQLDSRLSNQPMTRIFLNDGFGGFAGLASLGWIQSFADYGNYWAINNVNNDPDEMWKWEYNLSVILHEFGHTMGFGHAAYTEAQPQSFITDFSKPDNYGDGGSVMGSGNSWDTIPGPGHYYYRLSKSKVEPHYFKFLTEPVTKRFRLYAWDHPYSRLFLGTDESRFAPGEDIEGIVAEDNVMTVEIPFNRGDMCSTVSEDVSYGSFFLEYRCRYGRQEGAGNRGVRLVQGRVEKAGFDSTRTLMLPAGVDGLFSWPDNVIPAGVLWTPNTADQGTIGVQIHRIHSVTERVSEAQLDEPAQPFAKQSYLEVEVTYQPGVRYIPPLHPAPLPTYLTSPNVACSVNDKNSGYSCSLLGAPRFWFYMQDFAHRGHPRVYSLDSKWIDSAAASVVSVPGRERNGWLHYYGDYTRGSCRVEISRGESIGRAFVWQQAELFRKRVGESDEAFARLGEGDVLVASDLAVGEGETVVLMDLFGAEEALAVGDGGVVRFLPARALPGFYEAFVVKRKEGNVVAALRVTQQVAAMTEDRVAVEMVDAQTVEVSSAGIPSSMTSFPSMFYSRRLSRYQRLPLMFRDWTFGDFLLFDFAGTFPSNCFLFLETDNGVVSLSLRRLQKEKNVSLKLPYAQVIELGSFDGQIHFVWFSHTVTLLSVRAALASKVGAGEGTQSAKQDFYNLGGYRYKGVIGGFTGFAPRQYEARFGGRRYTVDTETPAGVAVRLRDESTGSAFLRWLAIAVGVVVALGVLWCLVAACRCRAKERTTASLPRSAPAKKKTAPKPVEVALPVVAPKPVPAKPIMAKPAPVKPIAAKPVMAKPAPAKEAEDESNPFDVPPVNFSSSKPLPPKPAVPPTKPLPSPPTSQPSSAAPSRSVATSSTKSRVTPPPRKQRMTGPPARSTKKV